MILFLCLCVCVFLCICVHMETKGIPLSTLRQGLTLSLNCAISSRLVGSKALRPSSLHPPGLLLQMYIAVSGFSCEC